MVSKTTLIRFLYCLALPGGFLLLAAAIALRLGFPPEAISKVRFLPVVLAVIGLVLSAIFRRSRLFFATAVLTVTQAALIWAIPHLTPGGGHTLITAIELLVPFNFLALAFMNERGIISPAGRRRMAALAVEIIAAGILCLPQLAGIAVWLERAFFAGRFSAWSGFSQPGLVMFAAAGIVMIVLLVRRLHPAESGLLWALVSSFFALRAGGVDYRATIFFSSAGLAIVAALLETSYKMAYHDELTQLPSRRALNEDLMKLPEFYTISMVDVDHFKKFNDSYGHEAGDQVLRLVATRLARVTGGGKAYRYGGEEFAILFPGKTAEDVLVYLEGLRRLIEQSTFVVRGKERRSGAKGKSRVSRDGKKETNVTVSIGVASCNGDRLAAADVLRAADHALYRAKAKGRNCTVSARPRKNAASDHPAARLFSAG